jgi:uncharacterized RDD family membrane protein YckC
MYCSNCGKELENDAQFCIHCGSKSVSARPLEKRSDAPGPAMPQSSRQDQQGEAVPQIRPWVRFFARLIDIGLIYILLLGIFVVLGVLIYIMLPQSSKGFLAAVSDMPGALDLLVTTMSAFLLLALIEPFFISQYGYTPGKWLLKTKVMNPDGTNLTYSQAFSRSFKVYTRGFLLGIPFLMFITLFIESSRLEKKGKTSWDAQGGFVVSHQKIGILRTITAIILFVFLRGIQMYFTSFSMK